MIENLINEIQSLSYEGRFSIYHRNEETLVRTYHPDGSQSKVTAETIEKALIKMIELLKIS